MKTTKNDVRITALPVEATFVWGDEEWFFPAVYFIDDRVSVEIFTQVDLKRAREFRKKWGKVLEDEFLSDTRRQSIESENPFFPHIFGEVIVNEEWLEPDFTSWYPWNPEDQRKDEDISFAKSRIKGYNCDPKKGWVFIHMEFCMPEFELEEFKDLEITFSNDDAVVFGKKTGRLREGQELSVIHPVTKEKHNIKILKYELKEFEKRYYYKMTYKVDPVPENELRLHEAEGDEFLGFVFEREEKEENPEEGILVNYSGLHSRVNDYFEWQVFGYKNDKKPATFNIVMPKERKEINADFFDKQSM